MSLTSETLLPKELEKAEEVARAWQTYLESTDKSGGIFNDVKILSEAVIYLQKHAGECHHKLRNWCYTAIAIGSIVGFCVGVVTYLVF